MATQLLKKINVVGTSGSGKSTFSRKLADVLSVEHIEMDSLYWQKNWTCLEYDELCSILKTMLQKERWVLDGNYTLTTPIKWKHVETVIWIDFSFIRTMFQAVKRAITRAITQKEIWKNTGNRESFRRTFFSRDSVLLWTLKTYRANRKKYLAIIASQEYSHITFVRLTSPKECANYLDELRDGL